MLPSNLKLDKGKTVICKKKLISTIGIKIISNKNIDKVEVYHEKFWKILISSFNEECRLVTERPRNCFLIGKQKRLLSRTLKKE